MNLQNLIDYGKYADIDIFSGVSVPDPLQTETTKSAIMIRCGLLTPVYPEPEIMQSAITHWFNTHQWTFEHLINVIRAKYSPIENYERTEEWTDKHTGTVENEGSGSDKHSGSDERITSGQYQDSHSGTDTEENTVSAYNSDNYQPDTKRTSTAGQKLNNTHSDTDKFTHGEQINRSDNNLRTDNLQDEHNARIHGNIGVTTNQQMIEQELELLRHFDIYTYIAKLFEEEFCLMIY